MKSKTSFFNGTVFRKDVQRFAPVWALFTILLLMGLVSIFNEDGVYYRANSVSDAVCITGLLGFLYAPLVAQLLFGDLYSARMCNALHALPLRRECWFGTHVTAGLAFAFVPYGAVALLAIPVLNLGVAWTAVPLWLLAACLQYLFFFALSLFCCMIVGNRFSQILVYGIVNFISWLVYWLVDNLYEPLLMGVRIHSEPFEIMCPVVMFMEGIDLITVDYQRLRDENGRFLDYLVEGISLGDEWGYLAVCALIAAALLAVSLTLYRKRKLECAGDFVAFRFLEPVFLVFFTLTAGGFCYLATDVFGMRDSMGYLFLAVGVAAGFFLGRMMLERTTRVFRPRAFGQLALLVGVFALTLLITRLDPIGITRRIPEAREVESVTITNSYDYTLYADQKLTVTDPEDIQKLIDAHESIISGESGLDEEGAGIWTVTINVEYTLRNGKSFAWFYDVEVGSAAADITEEFYTRFECVMGFPEEQIPERAKDLYHIYTDGMRDNTEDNAVDLDMEGLLNAIAADCAAGNMAQSFAYHLSPGDGEGSISIARSTYLELGFNADADIERGYVNYRGLYVFDSCTNTLAWLEANGLYDPNQADYYG